MTRDILYIVQVENGSVDEEWHWEKLRQPTMRTSAEENIQLCCFL